MQQDRLPFPTGDVVAGVDEAGRGPLAGPVVAAAVILGPGRTPAGLADSKLLAERQRERLATAIRCSAAAWSIAWADREEIDALNILQATMLSMRRALLGLALQPTHVRFDGNCCPSLRGSGLGCSVEAIVGGDGSYPEISAASILAKTFRDQIMRRLDRFYPDYGFAAHKGYATARHRRALALAGPCPQHRRSFAPVRLAGVGGTR
jgi:ribonuclease HII